MKKIVVLGNGFDLACGLPTHFSDFHAYLTENKKQFENNFFYFLLDETFYKKDGSYKDELTRLLKINSIDNWMDFELLLNHFLLESDYYRICNELFYAKVNNLRLFRDGIEGVENMTACYFNNLLLSNEIKDFECFLSLQLLEYENALCEYLNIIESETELLNINRERLLNQIIGKDECVGILTFNYTNPCSNTNLPIKFIHGNCYSNRNIIIGIDFTLNNKNRENNKIITYENIGYKRMFVKTYRKLILEHDTNYTNTIVGQYTDKISFYGHSLGQQDYSYFQSLFDLYEIYDSNIKLEFFYSEYQPGNKEIGKILDRVYRLINEYGKTLDNEDHGKNLLHKMLLEERIIITKI